MTLSGTVYHDVQPVRVEPDGVTWQYDEGMCKVDFTDCPESVRQAYHYDAAKAAAYHAAQVQARQEAETRMRQAVQENEARRAARAQAAMASAPVESATEREIIYRRSISPAASEATRALGQQMDDAAARQAAEPTGPWGVLAHSRVGKILSGVGLVNFAPLAVIATKDNSRASSQTVLGSSHTASPAGVPADYETRSYYDEVDRAAAFASGVPLKP